MLGAAYHTVRRYASGTWVDGVYSPGTESTTTVLGSIQPVRGRTVELHQEGARVVGTYWLFTTDDTLRLTHLSAVNDSDTIEFRGRAYKAFTDEDWMCHTTGLPHHSFLLVEIGEDAPGVARLLVAGDFLTVGGDKVLLQ
jgi:hypothetical protein